MDRDIEIELALVRDYINKNWSDYADFCDERGEDPQFIYEQLGGEER